MRLLLNGTYKKFQWQALPAYTTLGRVCFCRFRSSLRCKTAPSFFVSQLPLGLACGWQKNKALNTRACAFFTLSPRGMHLCTRRSPTRTSHEQYVMWTVKQAHMSCIQGFLAALVIMKLESVVTWKCLGTVRVYVDKQWMLLDPVSHTALFGVSNWKL